MNTRTKQLALLATCGFFLVACGQNKDSEEKDPTTVVQTTQAQTTVAQTTTQTTTASPTTTAPTTVAKADDSNAQEDQAVFEISLPGSITTMIVYHKGDQVTRQITKNIFDFTSLPGITEETKEIIAKAQKETVEATYKITKEQFKDMEGFLVKLETEGEKLIQSFDMDYTKIDVAKLKEIDPKFKLNEYSTSFEAMKKVLLEAGFQQK